MAIRGSGIAASCCSRLFVRAGLKPIWSAADRPRLPAVMLGQSAQKLLADICEQPDLFAGLPRVRTRIVAWGPNAQPIALPHSAVVASEDILLARIEHEAPALQEQFRPQDWTLFAARPLPGSAQQLDFGSRLAATSAVRLRARAPNDACWVESLDEGWLFLLPGIETAWLLSVGSRVLDLLARSRLIAGQIEDLQDAGREFQSNPRIADPLCAPGWFACGTAALGFDPLCGDGVGNAAREAILAAASVRAILEGAEVTAVLAHYRERLLGAFERHVNLCRQFYSSADSGPWWTQQIDACQRGIDWCQSNHEPANRTRYRLRGFSLEPVEPGHDPKSSAHLRSAAL